MIKIIAIVGKSGSGKSTILSELVKLNPEYNKIISCTTRPKREYETDGVDYHFLDKTTFAHKIYDGDMLEATEFNDWFYGTDKSSLKDGVNIGVFNPEGYENLLDMENDEICIIGFYIKATSKTRMLRSLNREDDPNVGEIIRRYMADEKDFSALDDNLIPIANLYNEDESDLHNNIRIINEAIRADLLYEKE